MASWNYIQPVEIRFGAGLINKIDEIAQELGIANGLLVADKFFMTNGLAQKIVDGSKGALTAAFGDVSPNPDVTEIDACAELIRKNKHGFVVALGGGSALDAAKAAASVCMTKESIAEYHGTGKQLPKEHLPLIAVPTTAGTGSEVTKVSVVTNHAIGKKAPINCLNFYPTLAVIDPELTYSCPPKVTAGCGIDVLCHAVEGFWSKNHQPICDEVALHACDLVFKYLERAYKDPQDVEAREKMCEASVMAGLAFTIPLTTGSHACSFPLTNIHGIPHGEACGITLDYFAHINANDPEVGPRMNDFAQKLGFRDMNVMADEIHALKARLGLRNGLKDLNLNEEQIADLVRISVHPNLRNNPVYITDEMLDEMYHYLATQN